MNEILKEHIAWTGVRWNDIEQRLYRFPNMYGASIVWGHDIVRSDTEHPYELAVIKWADKERYEIDYTTPITNDVIGYQNEEQIRDLLVRIKNLEEVVA